MRLNSWLGAAGIEVPPDLADRSIQRIVLDSREAGPGTCFAALRGNRFDGNDFAEAALAAGACCVLTDLGASAKLPGRVFVEGLASRLGPLARALYGRPEEEMAIAAVTGTNGKTSTAFLLEGMLQEADLRPALSSTVVLRHPGGEREASLTTPPPTALWEFLAEARSAGAKSLSLEVSSHALAQDRIAGILADVVVFTNLTHDHLDYHRTFEEYFAAKSLLFTRHLKANGTGVVQLDDPHGRVLRQQLGGRILGIAENPALRPEVLVERLETDLGGIRLDLRIGNRILSLQSPLVGRVFGFNLAGAAVAAHALGVPEEAIVRGAARVLVPGRCEVVEAGGLRGVVDYAHTPDALERLLAGLRPLVAGKLVCVVGCGGDRDRGKRAPMGRLAATLADRAVLTSDNPRSEDPLEILAQMRSGVPADRVVEIVPDRAEAIASAVAGLGPDDLVVVAGKGHERTQTTGSVRIPFDDVAHLRAALLHEGNQ